MQELNINRSSIRCILVQHKIDCMTVFVRFVHHSPCDLYARNGCIVTIYKGRCDLVGGHTCRVAAAIVSNCQLIIRQRDPFGGNRNGQLVAVCLYGILTVGAGDHLAVYCNSSLIAQLGHNSEGVITSLVGKIRALKSKFFSGGLLCHTDILLGQAGNSDGNIAGYSGDCIGSLICFQGLGFLTDPVSYHHVLGVVEFGNSNRELIGIGFQNDIVTVNGNAVHALGNNLGNSVVFLCTNARNSDVNIFAGRGDGIATIAQCNGFAVDRDIHTGCEIINGIHCNAEGIGFPLPDTVAARKGNARHLRLGYGEKLSFHHILNGDSFVAIQRSEGVLTPRQYNLLTVDFDHDLLRPVSGIIHCDGKGIGFSGITGGLAGNGVIITFRQSNRIGVFLFHTSNGNLGISSDGIDLVFTRCGTNGFAIHCDHHIGGIVGTIHRNCEGAWLACIHPLGASDSNTLAKLTGYIVFCFGNHTGYLNGDIAGNTGNGIIAVSVRGYFHRFLARFAGNSHVSAIIAFVNRNLETIGTILIGSFLAAKGKSLAGGRCYRYGFSHGHGEVDLITATSNRLRTHSNGKCIVHCSRSATQGAFIATV